MKPRIRIVSDGARQAAVTVVSPHGAVTDISLQVIRASWSLAGGQLADVQLTVVPEAVDLLGDLTEVTVTHLDRAGGLDVTSELAHYRTCLAQLVEVARAHVRVTEHEGNPDLVAHLGRFLDAHYPEAKP